MHALKLAISGKFAYCLGMIQRNRLEEIIDRETDAAEQGCDRARGLIVNAQGELDQLDGREEMAMRLRQQDDDDLEAERNI